MRSTPAKVYIDFTEESDRFLPEGPRWVMIEGRPALVWVNIQVDALPKHELVGRVDSFAPASGNQFALLPADNATGNFTKIVQRVPVKITFKPEDLQKYSGRLVPGMSTVVEIDLRQKTAAAAK